MSYRELASRLPKFSLEWPFVLQMGASEGISFEQAREVTFVNNLAAFTSCLRPHIYDIICYFDDIRIMLYHNHRIAFITQFFQLLDPGSDIPGQSPPGVAAVRSTCERLAPPPVL